MEAAARLERIDRHLGELGEVLRELAASRPPGRPPSTPIPAPVTDAEVEAGPFVTLGAVEALHEQISSLPSVADVALRGFAGDRALLDVTLR